MSLCCFKNCNGLKKLNILKKLQVFKLTHNYNLRNNNLVLPVVNIYKNKQSVLYQVIYIGITYLMILKMFSLSLNLKKIKNTN